MCIRDRYQGLFLSPTVVSGALKGAVFAANIYERLGYACVPNATESRHDIIQAVTLGSAEAMVAFCKGIQAAAPVDLSLIHIYPSGCGSTIRALYLTTLQPPPSSATTPVTVIRQ